MKGFCVHGYRLTEYCYPCDKQKERTMKTKKRLIKEAIIASPSYTDTQIAKQVKCHPSYVHLVRKAMFPVYDEAAEVTEAKAKPITLDELKKDVMERYEGTAKIDQYGELAKALKAAYNQAAYGKGAERHANDDPWTEQPIFKIASQAGDGFNVGQVIKKVQEAQQMAARGENEKARHEVLGAIVYAASLYVIWGKKGG